MRETKYCVQFNWCRSFMTVYMDLCSAHNNSIVLDSWAISLSLSDAHHHHTPVATTKHENVDWKQQSGIIIIERCEKHQAMPYVLDNNLQETQPHSHRRNGKMHGWRKQTIISIFANILLVFAFFYFVVVVIADIVAALAISWAMRPVSLLLCVGCNELCTYTARWRFRFLPCIVSVLRATRCEMRNAHCQEEEEVNAGPVLSEDHWMN